MVCFSSPSIHRFSGVLRDKKEGIMALGTPPLRLSIRNSPRKITQESLESSGSSVGIVTPSRIGTIPSARKALTPIAEIVSNPLSSDVPICEATVASGKRDVTTPKKQTVENKSFCDAENVTECMEGTTVGTSGKLTGITPGRSKNILAGLSKKSPVVARSVQELCYSETQTDGARTPKRRLAYNSEVVQAQTSAKSSTKIPSEHLTPKSFRSAGRKGANEAEIGTSSRCGSGQLITPSSARTTRPLKHGGTPGILSSGLGIRASISSSLNRQLVMPHVSHHFIEQHFDLELDPHFWDDHNVQVRCVSSITYFMTVILDDKGASSRKFSSTMNFHWVTSLKAQESFILTVMVMHL